MTSLMQHQGLTGRHGVRLEFVLRAKDAGPFDPPAEAVRCHVCGREHERIHVAWRRPAGLWGSWVVFRYLGGKHVPDLSIPIDVPQIPRGAVALSDKETSEAWHR